MKDTFRLCRKCGKPIGVISTGLYKSILVDADPKEVFPDPLGDIFVRIDGSKMRGKLADSWEDDRPTAEIVWKPHRCGGQDDL